MTSRTLKFFLVALALAGLLAAGAADYTSRAAETFVWDKAVKLTPKTKPNRQRTQARIQRISNKGVEEAPLLALKYRVLKRGEGSSATSIDPTGELATGDQVKLAITTNQNGFLYVVHHSKDERGYPVDQARMIFPDPRIKDGRNEVVKDTEYVIPADCREFDDPEDCWWEITPPSGREFFTIVFSRDRITTLPPTGELVQEADLDRIRQGSGQLLVRADQAVTVSRRVLEDGVFVQNTNKQDNEEIFETVDLKHLTPTGDDPGIRTRAIFLKKRSDGLRVTVLRDGAPVDPAQVFTEDDELKVRLRSNFPGYVYFVNVTPSAKRCLIFPCTASMGNQVSAGEFVVFPSDPHVIGFDQEKGTEVFQVIVARERIAFLEALLKDRNCCDEKRGCICELSGSASSAAAELAGASKKTGIVGEGLVAAVPQESAGGVRARGIKLAAGKDRTKSETYVAIDPQEGSRLESGQAVVFEVRLEHR